MGLFDTPPTRPRTYVIGTQLEPNDMNELFDVGIAVRSPQPIAFPGCAFNGVNTTVDNGRTLKFSGAAVVYAPLVLPVGTTIKTLLWSYLVGAAGSVSLLLIRGKLDTSDALDDITPVSGSESDATNAGVTESSLVTYDHVIEAGYVYFLRFECSNNASELYGCILTPQ